MRAHLPAITAFVEGVRADGLRDVVLCGMGGSSLAAEVFARVFGPAAGHPALHVLDATDPEVVAAVAAAVDPDTTLFLIASKSGKTLETACFRAHFEEVVRSAGSASFGRHFAAITDPASPLAEHARRWDYRAVFENPPDVGGRYAALTLYGLVPAALLGVDVARLLDRAAEEATWTRASEVPPPALVLGAALGALAGEGVDKLELRCSPRLAPLAAWVEQLVAESTGKDGRGVLPLLGAEGTASSDRFVLRVALAGDAAPAEVAERAGDTPHGTFEIDDPYELGALFYRFQLATAVAAAVLGVDPFDEPDVRAAKDATAAALGGASPSALDPIDGGSYRLRVPGSVRTAHGDLGEDAGAWLRAHVGAARPGDYVAILSFLAGTPERDRRLESLRAACAERAGVPVTLGVGPRCLHSTGQLHKGGPDTGVFLVLASALPRRAADLSIPGRPHTFGALVFAQAEGEFRALEARGRRVLAVTLPRPPDDGLAALEAALAGPA